MPICPACHADYAPGVERCHDCELPLVESLEQGGPTEDPSAPQSLVTVAAFPTPVQAALLASRLESEGIETFIVDGEVIGMYGLASGAFGGVKVQVRTTDEPRASFVAREHLDETVRPPSRSCPRCSSTAVRRKGISGLQAFFVVLTLGVLSLFFSARWHCTACGHSWR